MVIIIEGIDRVGKTTLANKLSEKFNIPIIKQERIGGNTDNSSSNSLINFGRAIGIVDLINNDCFEKNIIFDRFHWTEAVYGLCDRNIKESVDRMSYVENIMSKHSEKYFIIQVVPVDINWCSRQHGKNLESFQLIFDDLYNRSKLDKYKCTFYSFDLCMKEVERRLKNNVKM